jgi:hypothetical protein
MCGALQVVKLQPKVAVVCHTPEVNMHFFLFSWGWVRLSPLGTSANNWSIVAAPDIDDDDDDDGDDDDDDDERGADGGMRIAKCNRNTRIKSASMPLCPPQITHDLTWS